MINGLHYMYGSATVIQLLWTGVGLVGLFVTLHLLFECLSDRRALRTQASFQPGGIRDIIALNNIRNMAFRAAILLVAVAIGVGSMFSPVAVYHMTARAVWQGVGVCAIEVVIVLSAIYDRRDRAALFYHIRTRRVDTLVLTLKTTQQEAIQHDSENPGH